MGKALPKIRKVVISTTTSTTTSPAASRPSRRRPDQHYGRPITTKKDRPETSAGSLSVKWYLQTMVRHQTTDPNRPPFFSRLLDFQSRRLHNTSPRSPLRHTVYNTPFSSARTFHLTPSYTLFFCSFLFRFLFLFSPSSSCFAPIL